MKLYHCRKCGQSFNTTFEGNLCLACLSNQVLVDDNALNDTQEKRKMNNEEKTAKALELLKKTWVTVDFFCHDCDLSKEVRKFLDLCEESND
jgi:hypothetical protein